MEVGELTLTERLINIFSIPVYLFCFCVFFFCMITHIRKKILMQKFFRVLFVMNTVKMVLCLFCLINAIVVLTNSGDVNEVYIHIVSFILNFSYTTSVVYNIITLYYLIYKNTTKENLIEKDIKVDQQKYVMIERETISDRYSISLKNQSFLMIHLLSLAYGFIFAACVLFLKQDGNFLWGLYSINSNWEETYKAIILVILFLPHWLYIIFSLPYCFISWRSKGITNHIYLKSYSLNCTVSALLSMIFPVTICLNFSENVLTKKIIEIFCFILVVIVTLKNSIFHLSLFYIQSILSKKGNSFSDKLKVAFDVIFCRPFDDLDIVDYNSQFIQQSLSTYRDFSDMFDAVSQVSEEDAITEDIKDKN